MSEPRSKVNKKLPKGWRYKDGWYRYRPSLDERPAFDNKSEFYLSKTCSSAVIEWAKRINYADEITKLGQLSDQYEVEVVPDKAPATRKLNRYSLSRLRKVFYEVPVAQLILQLVLKYRDLCAKSHGKKKANLDMEVLYHSITVANIWGVLDKHPLMNRRIIGAILPLTYSRAHSSKKFESHRASALEAIG